MAAPKAASLADCCPGEFGESDMGVELRGYSSKRIVPIDSEKFENSPLKMELNFTSEVFAPQVYPRFFEFD